MRTTIRPSLKAGSTLNRSPWPCRWGFALLASGLLVSQMPAADLVWTNTAGGNWSTAANWKPNQVPGSADTAWITNNGTYTVTVSADTAPGSLTLGGDSGTQTLNLAGGTFTLDGPGSGNTHSALSLNYGNLAGSGELIISGALSWTYGTMRGTGKTTVAGTGSLSLSGSSHSLQRVLQNDGTATWTVGDLRFNGGTFNNNGTFTVTSSGTLSCVGDNGVNAFNNAGTFTQQGPGLITLAKNFTEVNFNNSGTVMVQAGTLGCDTGGTQSGHFTVASNATLRLSGVHTFGVTADITGPGSVSVLNSTSGGATTINGSFTNTTALNISGGTVNANGTLTFGSGSLSSYGTLGGSGELTISGAMNWADGTMSGTGKTIIASTGSLSLSVGNHSLQRILQNDGTATWTAGNFYFNGGTFNNNGSLTANSSAAIVCRGDGGANAFNNAGTFTQQGAGTTSVSRNMADVNFNNSGTVMVQAGTLGCDTGGTQSGHFTVASNATLRLSGIHTFGVTADITGPGSVSVLNGTSGGTTTINGSFTNTTALNISGGTVNANGTLTFGSGSLSSGTLAGSGELTISGALSWADGTMSGTGKTIIASTGSLSLSVGNHSLQRILQNDGTATWTAGNFYFNGGTFNNNGSLTANSSAAIVCRGDGGVNAFNNAGTFTQQGPGAITLGRNFADVNFNNSGTVNIRGSTLSLMTCVQTAGLTLLNGGALSCSSAVQLQGGTLAGTNTLTGSVNNTGGILSAGVSPGKLTITGNYVQGSGGAMAVELGGTTPGTGFDWVAVGGSATLAGTLNASLYGGFYPAPNATFTYLTAASRSGAFSSFNYPSNVIGLTNELAATTGTIRVINTLPVITPVGDRTNDEMAAFIVTATANDYDTPAQTLTWSLVSGPSGLGIASGGAITWTPAEDQGPSTNTVRFRVTDNGIPNLSTTNAFELVINEINRAPALFLPPDTTINEETPLNLTASATDPDIPTNTLTFELVSGPPGLTVSPEGAIAWLPGEADGPAVHAVTVRVTDYNADAVNEKHLSTAGTFNINVREVNRPPTLTVPENQVVLEELPLTLTCVATDPDLPANALSFSLLSPPEGATIHPTSGVITWTPSEAQGSNVFTITVAVTDDSPMAVNERHLSITNSFTVTVNESNRPPVLAMPVDQVITEETSLAVSVSATDPDLPTNALTFALLAPPEGMSIDPVTGAITWTPTEAQGPSTNTITVVVTDDNPRAVNEHHLSATNTFTVTVNESNRPPVLAMPVDQVITEETPLAISASATDPDVPTNALTFSLLSPPEGMSIDPVTGAITWTPTEAQGPSTNTITVVVTDDNPRAVNEHHLSATNAFIVTVQESNSPPVLAPIADKTITAGDLYTDSAVATDRDIPANLLSFSLLSAPDGMAITAAGEVSWQTSDADAYTTNQISVVVSDDGTPLLTATQMFTVIVLPYVRLQLAVEQSEVTDQTKNPPVATQYTTYPEVSWSSKPGARYGFHDADSLHDLKLWHTNLFDGVPWVISTGTKTKARGPFIRQSIPAWGLDEQGPSARFFKVQPLP